MVKSYREPYDEFEERFFPERERKGKRDRKFTEKKYEQKARACGGKRTAYFTTRSCTNKRRFADEEDAKNYANWLKGKLSGTGKVFDKCRIYHCQICGGYHMTSIGAVDDDNGLTQEAEETEINAERVDQPLLP